MKLNEIVVGVTGYTDGYGCDRYPHTVVSIQPQAPKRGRKPKGWVKGSRYVELTVQNDDLVWDKKPDNALGTCNADTGGNGEHKDVWFVANPHNRMDVIRVVELPTGDVLCNGLGYRSYNRDSSF